MMMWETPVLEEIECGMEVTAYVNTDDRQQRPEPAVEPLDAAA